MLITVDTKDTNIRLDTYRAYSLQKGDLQVANILKWGHRPPDMILSESDPAQPCVWALTPNMPFDAELHVKIDWHMYLITCPPLLFSAAQIRAAQGQLNLAMEHVLTCLEIWASQTPINEVQAATCRLNKLEKIINLARHAGTIGEAHCAAHTALNLTSKTTNIQELTNERLREEIQRITNGAECPPIKSSKRGNSSTYRRRARY